MTPSKEWRHPGEAMARLAVFRVERRDLEIIDRHADELNAEAEDVLGLLAQARGAAKATASGSLTSDDRGI